MTFSHSYYSNSSYSYSYYYYYYYYYDSYYCYSYSYSACLPCLMSDSVGAHETTLDVDGLLLG